MPGIAASDPDIGFGNWDCDWYSTTSEIEAKLRYDRDQPPTDEDARATRLGGHDAFVIKEGDGPETCLVLVVHRSYADQHGEPAVEMLHLVVGGPRSMDKLCGMATDLAGSAAAELPGGAR